MDELNSIKIIIDGKEISFPFISARTFIMNIIPAWMKSSEIEPPMQEEADGNALISPDILKIIRSGFKNLARPLLPRLYLAIYGKKLDIGRNDSLPVLMQLIVDFVLLQIILNPIEITTHEGNITSFRPFKRGVQKDNTAI
jgi:hypothetical protein